MKNRLWVLLLISTVLIAGCGRLDVEVGKVVDNFIIALKAKDVTGLEKLLVTDLATTINDKENGTEEITNRDDFLVFIGANSPWKMSKVELSGRKVTVNGSSATVMGAFLQEYVDECEDFYSKYRRTADLSITLTRVNKVWVISKLVFANHSHVCLESSIGSAM